MVQLKPILLTTFAVFAVTANAGRAQLPSDSELFAQGRVALDKYNDCPSAKRSFEAESVNAQDSAVWLEYTARASECAGYLEAALGYYERESKKLPGTARLIDKVGELRYRIQSLRDQAARKAEQENALARQKTEQENALAQQRDQEYQDAVRRLPETYEAIKRLLTESYEDDRKGDFGSHKAFLTRTVTNVSNCELSFDEEYRGRVKLKRSVKLSLVEASAEKHYDGFKFGRGGVSITGGAGSSPGYVELDGELDAKRFVKLISSAALACRR